ncbi:MAG: hypothetical protein IJQ50_02205 [Clostridia bacterium]|nr:hypothetical protein [Clostridia bacterium]
MSNISKTYATRDGAKALAATQGAASQTIACDTADERTAFIVTNSSDSEAATVTVVAGNGIRSSIGNLVVTVPKSSEYIIGPLDSMRFKNLSTGAITVTISGGTTTVKPFSL